VRVRFRALRLSFCEFRVRLLMAVFGVWGWAPVVLRFSSSFCLLMPVFGFGWMWGGTGSTTQSQGHPRYSLYILKAKKKERGRPYLELLHGLEAVLEILRGVQRLLLLRTMRDRGMAMVRSIINTLPTKASSG